MRRFRVRASIWQTLLISGAVLLAGKASAELSAGPWPMFQHDSQHTGQAAIQGPSSAQVRWVFHGDARFRTPIAVGPDGTVYIGHAHDPVLAVNPHGTKKSEWINTGFAGDAAFSGPTIGYDPLTMQRTIYIGNRDNKLWAIRETDGTARWSYKVLSDGDVWSSPAIGADGAVYMSSGFGGWFHSLAPNGDLNWRVLLKENTRDISPAIAPDGTVYMATIKGTLLAFNPASSTPLWSVKFAKTNRLSSSPAIGADGTIYIGSGAGVSAINPTTHVALWNAPLPKGVATTPAIANNGSTDTAIYVGSTDRNVYALRPSDGAILWHHARKDRVLNSLSIGSDGVVYGTAGAWVFALDPGDGHEIWSYKTGRRIMGPGAIGPNQTYYVGSADHYLYAFGQPLP